MAKDNDSKNEKPKPKPRKTVVNNFYGPVRITGTTGKAADGRTFQVGIDSDEDDED